MGSNKYFKTTPLKKEIINSVLKKISEIESDFENKILSKKPVSQVLALLIFILISCLVSWPLVKNFSTRPMASIDDGFFTIWFNWFFKEVLSGNLSLDPVQILYFPKGIPWGVMGLGPLIGFFGIPFWGFGHIATLNGSYLLAMTATGYCMFLLARSLRLNWISSVFAGIALEISPLVLYGLFGHSIKAFQGNLALYLLFLNQLSVDKKHVAKNIVLGAFSMFLCLFHDANYFIFAIITTVVFVSVKFLLRSEVTRIMLLKRMALLTLSSMIICSPYLLSLFRAYQSNDFNVKMDQSVASSADYSVDLASYFLPNNFNTIFGQYKRAPNSFILEDPQIKTNTIYGRFLMTLENRYPNYNPSPGISLAYSLIVLVFLGLKGITKKNLPFYIIFLIFFVLALGPYLRFLGEFIRINGEKIHLPFYFLSKIPGFDFIRVPSRFMMMGYVALAAISAFGMNSILNDIAKADIY